MNNSEKIYKEKSDTEFEENDKFKEEKDKSFDEYNDIYNEKNFREEKSNVKNKSKKEKKLKKEKKHYGEKKLNNIFFNVKNIYTKFMYLKNYPEKRKIIKYTLNLIKELFFAIKPKEFQVDLTVGFDNPADTGKFLGFAAIISEFIPFDINLKGNFNDEVFEGDFEIQGKTNIFKIGVPILKYIFKEPIWKLIKSRKG